MPHVLFHFSFVETIFVAWFFTEYTFYVRLNKSSPPKEWQEEENLQTIRELSDKVVSFIMV